MTHDVSVDPRMYRKTGPAQRSALARWATRLASDPGAGQRVPRHMVPSRFALYGVIFRISLPDGWRALYAVASKKDRRASVVIVWIGDHQEYDRLFGYRRN